MVSGKRPGGVVLTFKAEPETENCPEKQTHLGETPALSLFLCDSR